MSMEEHNKVVIPAVQGVLDWKSSMQLDISMVGKVKRGLGWDISTHCCRTVLLISCLLQVWI